MFADRAQDLFVLNYLVSHVETNLLPYDTIA